MNKPLFQVIYEDNSIYEGGNYQDTKWLGIDKNKKIRSLFYLLPTGDYLGLGGFKRVYQYIEVLTDLNGSESGKKKIDFICIIVEKEDNYIQYKINHQEISIEINILSKNSDYIKNLNPVGWRN
jgi:hypothetical protein